MAIKTWEERSVTLPDMGWADKQYANKHAMLDEIKELRARVAELEEELATAIECYSMQLAKDTVQSDIDCIMAQGVEIAQLKVELAAVRNQQPVAYRAWFDKDSGARFLFTLWPEEEQLDVDWEPLFLAAGAQTIKQPLPSERDALIKSLREAYGDCYSHLWRQLMVSAADMLFAGAQPVPEGMALDAGAKLNSCTGCYADQVIGESRPCRTCIRSGAISDRFEAAKEPK